MSWRDLQDLAQVVRGALRVLLEDQLRDGELTQDPVIEVVVPFEQGGEALIALHDLGGGALLVARDGREGEQGLQILRVLFEQILADGGRLGEVCGGRLGEEGVEGARDELGVRSVAIAQRGELLKGALKIPLKEDRINA